MPMLANVSRVEALQERDEADQEWLAYAQREADGGLRLDRDEGIDLIADEQCSPDRGCCTYRCATGKQVWTIVYHEHMAELKLSFGLEKLIDTVSQGLGALTRPWMIRRVARAQADGLHILAGAENDISALLRLPATTHTAVDAAAAAIINDKSQTEEVSLDLAEVFERRMQ